MQLYLIRHPQPEIAAGICYGQSDLAVSDAECRLVQTQLQNRLPRGVPLFSSPLQRCVKLARLLHATPLLDARLMELDFGAWEMQRWDAIARDEIDAWAADVTQYPVGGGESVLDMATRVIEFLHDLKKTLEPQAIIVAHAGSIRMLQAFRPGMQAIDLAREVAASDNKIAFGACMEWQIML